MFKLHFSFFLLSYIIRSAIRYFLLKSSSKMAIKGQGKIINLTMKTYRKNFNYIYKNQSRIFDQNMHFDQLNHSYHQLIANYHQKNVNEPQKYDNRSYTIFCIWTEKCSITLLPIDETKLLFSMLLHNWGCC